MVTASHRPESTLVAYHLLKWLVVSPSLHLAFRLKIEGAEHVPPTGPVVIASNHASNFDPLILANCARRPVAFMAKEELFHNSVLARIIRTYGAFPVKRGSGDRGAIRSALEALELGWAVGIFINGTRTEDGSIPNPQLGAAMIAAKAGVPLIPAAIVGSGAILPRGRIVPRLAPLLVRFGPALPPPSNTRREALEASTSALSNRIQHLLV